MKRIFLMLLLLLTGCLGKPVREAAPAPRPADLAQLPDPMPRLEARSANGNKDPYQVLGKTYRVLASAQGYLATGKASWYGAKFHGRKTASGEIYNMYQLTAAHRSLPIPSYVRVTNLANHLSTVVRVNDRGPFHNDRIIDLSYAAAVKLDFADQGTTRVRVQALMGKPIFLQAGAYAQVQGAVRLSDALRQLLGKRVEVMRSSTDGLYRVRIGPLNYLQEVTRIRTLMLTANYAPPLILQQ